jgi:hypothetical protein
MKNVCHYEVIDRRDDEKVACKTESLAKAIMVAIKLTGFPWSKIEISCASLTDYYSIYIASYNCGEFVNEFNLEEIIAHEMDVF